MDLKKIFLQPAAKVTLIYLIIASLWIYLSDTLVHQFVTFEHEQDKLYFSIFKGMFYVIITSFLLYQLIKEYYRANDKKIAKLQEQQDEILALQKLASVGLWEYNVVEQKFIWSDETKEIFEVKKKDDPQLDDIVNFIKEIEFKSVFKDFMATIQTSTESFSLEFEVITALDNFKWLIVSGKPIVRNGQVVKVTGSFQDITVQKNAQEDLQRLNRLADFVINVNHVMIQTVTLEELFIRVCNIAVEIGKFRMAWIGELDEPTLCVNPIAYAGYDNGYLAKLNISIDPSKPGGNGPSAHALRTGDYFVCKNINNDPFFKVWRKDALQRGYKSSISLPIFKNGKPKYSFNLYSSVPDYFDKSEIALLIDTVADITYAIDGYEKEIARDLAEKKMKEALDLYDTVTSSTKDTIYDFDVKEGIFYFNDGIANVFGYPSKVLRYPFEWVKSKLHPNDFSKFVEMYRECKLQQKNFFQTDARLKCFDGTYKNVITRSYIRYSENGIPVRIVGAILDVTSEIEQESNITRAIIKTQEQERQQMGMELHDNINQILSATLIYIGLLKEKINLSETSADEFIRIDNLIRTAIDEIRRLSHRLSPISIEEIPLDKVFLRLIETYKISDKYKIQIHFKGLEDVIISNDIKVTFYRILQEQLNNILKYAKASKINVVLNYQNGVLLFCISDDGKGVDLKVHSTGIGLENIRRRSKLLGGDMSVKSSPGEGFEITVKIPLSEG
jgi:two-component system sensor histidine kinase UhpB